jgi:hypothetical protein
MRRVRFCRTLDVGVERRRVVGSLLQMLDAVRGSFPP